MKFEVVHVEKTRANYFDLFAVRSAVVKWAVDWEVKKSLGRVQKADEYAVSYARKRQVLLAGLIHLRR